MSDDAKTCHKNDEMKPCPECDARGEDGPAYEHTSGGARVTCACGLSTQWCDSMDKAWEAWDALTIHKPAAPSPAPLSEPRITFTDDVLDELARAPFGIQAKAAPALLSALKEARAASCDTQAQLLAARDEVASQAQAIRALRARLSEVEKERDAARKQFDVNEAVSEALDAATEAQAERDEARSEVERLTKERDTLQAQLRDAWDLRDGDPEVNRLRSEVATACEHIRALDRACDPMLPSDQYARRKAARDFLAEHSKGGG